MSLAGDTWQGEGVVISIVLCFCSGWSKEKLSVNEDLSSTNVMKCESEDSLRACYVCGSAKCCP